MSFHHHLKNFLLLGGLCLLCAGCATTGEADDSGASMETAAAEPSKSSSDEELGMAYLTGHGQPQNPQQAIYYLEKAAEHGSAQAANELGYLYLSGKGGTPPNYGLALQYFQQAAEAGISSAQYNLGLIYAKGLGTAADPLKAKAYFTQAAQLGFSPAQKRSTL